MNMKKRAILLSFVGATVLTLGLQTQEVYANTYVNKANYSYSHKNSYRGVRDHHQFKDHRYNDYRWDGCEGIVIQPTPGPGQKPNIKPVPKPEVKPDIKPVPKPEIKPDIKPVPKPEVKPDIKPVPKPEVKPDIKPVPQPTPEVNPSINNFEIRVVELTNVERAKSGLSPLKMDNDLSKVAKLKSQDIQSKGYFDHTSPTYGSPFEMMKQFGISYRSAGENIAKGQRTPEEVVNAWMNSEGHRKNILGDFTHIGVGYLDTGNVWTQMFITK